MDDFGAAIIRWRPEYAASFSAGRPLSPLTQAPDPLDALPSAVAAICSMKRAISLARSKSMRLSSV
jgi:hypothetical protein